MPSGEMNSSKSSFSVLPPTAPGTVITGSLSPYERSPSTRPPGPMKTRSAIATTSPSTGPLIRTGALTATTSPVTRPVIRTEPSMTTMSPTVWPRGTSTSPVITI